VPTCRRSVRNTVSFCCMVHCCGWPAGVEQELLQVASVSAALKSSALRPCDLIPNREEACGWSKSALNLGARRAQRLFHGSAALQVHEWHLIMVYYGSSIHDHSNKLVLLSALSLIRRRFILSEGEMFDDPDASSIGCLSTRLYMISRNHSQTITRPSVDSQTHKSSSYRRSK